MSSFAVALPRLLPATALGLTIGFGLCPRRSSAEEGFFFSSEFLQWIAFLRKLRSLSKDVLKQTDWALWALDVPSIVDTGRLAEPVPGSQHSDEILARCQQIRAAARDLTVPPFEASLPADGPVTSDWDGMRDVLSGRVEVFSTAALEMVERTAGRDELKAEVDALDKLVTMLVVLADIFGTVSAHAPTYEWAKAWAIPMVDILGLYKPLIDDAASDLSVRLAVLEQGIAMRRGELEATAALLRNRLAVEAAALKGERDRIVAWKEDLDARKASLDADEASIVAAQAEVRSLTQQISSYAAYRYQLEQERDALFHQHTGLQETADAEDAKQHDYRTNKVKWPCPEGNAYVNCTAASHAGWRRSMAQRIESSEARERTAREEIGSVDRSIADNDANIEQAETEEGELRRQRDDLDAETRRRRLAFDETLARWKEEALEFAKQLWSSRATVHWDGNRGDAARIDELITWMNR